MSEPKPTQCKCGHLTPMLEELSDEAGGGWRVCCYMCHRQTTNGLYKRRALDALIAWHDFTDPLLRKEFHKERPNRWIS